MGLGWHNPMPLQLGGGPTDIELLWQGLRDAVGIGGPGPEGSMEDLWRQAKARAIAFSASSMERAAIQAFPQHATDWLTYYESLLGIVPAIGETDDQRREEVARQFAKELLADGANLEAALQEIESTATILAVDPDTTITAQFGKAFAARPYVESFGTNNASNYPAYSTELKVTAQITLAAGVTQIPALTLIRLRTTLNELLPAWVDFAVTQIGPSGAGFYLDGGPTGESRLDLTAFGS